MGVGLHANPTALFALDVLGLGLWCIHQYSGSFFLCFSRLGLPVGQATTIPLPPTATYKRARPCSRFVHNIPLYNTIVSLVFSLIPILHIP